MLNSKFADVSRTTVLRVNRYRHFHAGDFGGHWFSATDVRVETKLKDDEFDMLVTVRNAGHAPLPMGIGWHPYFILPSGDRTQVRLHLPSETRAIMNNYDDSFVTGKLVSVEGHAV